MGVNPVVLTPWQRRAKGSLNNEGVMEHLLSPIFARRVAMILSLGAVLLLALVQGCDRGTAEVIALVDGEAITLAEFKSSMLQERGAGFFGSQFLERYLVEREAQRTGISVTPQDAAERAIQKERYAILQDFQGSREVLDLALESRGLTLDGWRRSLNREARHEILSERLWQARTRQDEEVLKERFEQRYGRHGVRYKLRQVFIGFDIKRSRFYTKSEHKASADAVLAFLRAEAKELRGRAVSGEPFSELARKHSDAVDAQRGGDLANRWTSRYREAFEAAVASMSFSGIAPLVETSKGLHLIEVYNIHQRGEPRASLRHIFLSRDYQAVKRRKLAEEIREMAKQRAEEVLASLKEGADFAKLAHRFSDDIPSRTRGGVVPHEHYLSLPEPVRKAAEEMKPGDPPRSIASSEGYSVFEVLERHKTLYEAVRPSLQQEIAGQVPTQRDLTPFLKQIVKRAKVERLADWL